MPSLDDEIDALYGLPPGEFIQARNQLAKRAGGRAAEIKALAKPAAPAWAVNQVYWHSRGVFDALVRASQSSRGQQVRRLGGERIDTTAADAAHRRALDKAIAAATSYLRGVGDAVSPATVTALTRTFESVPSPDVQGRLVKPIEPVGFGLLASVLGQTGVSLRQPAEVVVMPRPSSRKVAASRPAAHDEEKARHAARTRAQQRERLQHELADVDAREREAAATLERTARAIDRITERMEELQAELQELQGRLAAKKGEAKSARHAGNKATAERAAVIRKLDRLERDGG